MGAYALAALALLAAPGSPAAGTADAAINPEAARQDLNAMRAAVGLPPVAHFSARLNRGCRQHNRYMSATGEFGHAERRDSPYYTVGGARAAARSVIAWPSALPSGAWGDSVYHRMALLQPRLRTGGFAANDGYSCLQVLSGVSDDPGARAPQPALYVWPPDGGQGYAPAFGGGEFPDPLADALGASELGTPITVTVNGPWRHWQLVGASVSSASLVSDLGVSVPVSASDRSSANGAYLQGGFALLPRVALEPFTWYTAHASGRLTYMNRSWPFELTTRFQTGDDYP